VIVLFYIVAAISIFSAMAVITRMRLFTSVCWLGLFYLSLSILCAMLSAPLVAILHLIVSISLVAAFILVAMTLSGIGEVRTRVMHFGMILGAAAAGYLVIVLVLAIIRSPITETPLVGLSFESPVRFAIALMNEYAMPFAALGFLILTSVLAITALLDDPRAEELK